LGVDSSLLLIVPFDPLLAGLDPALGQQLDANDEVIVWDAQNQSSIRARWLNGAWVDATDNNCAH
jgi:hypothetical protein